MSLFASVKNYDEVKNHPDVWVMLTFFIGKAAIMGHKGPYSSTMGF